MLDPLALRARRVRALFLCGLQEGVFPAPARPEPYLPRRSAAGSRKPGIAAGAAEGCAGGGALPAVCGHLTPVGAVGVELAHRRRRWPADGPLSVRGRHLRPLRGEPHETRARRALGEVSPIAPTSPVFGSEEGDPALRDPRVLAELGGQRLWSASGLQSWAGCPVQWFVERMLGARDLEPEAEPLARGGLAHAALRQTLERLREETGSARLTTERLPRARELLRAALKEHEREHPLSTVPERVPGVRRRLEADLERYLEYAAECGDRAEG